MPNFILLFSHLSLILILNYTFLPSKIRLGFFDFRKEDFYGILDFYVCNGSADSIPDDQLWRTFFQKCSKGNQFRFWLPHFHVYEKCRYLAVCPSLFWENLAYPWLDSDHTFCHSNAFVIGKGNDPVGNMGLIITFLQLIPLILPIFFTEKALRAHFDRNGNRIF